MYCKVHTSLQINIFFFISERHVYEVTSTINLLFKICDGMKYISNDLDEKLTRRLKYYN